MSDDDIVKINTNAVSLNLVYRAFVQHKFLLVCDRCLMHMFTLLQVHTTHETSRQSLRWLKQSVWNPARFKELNRKNHIVSPIHTGKSGPSDFRPVTASDGLFARCILRHYGTIPCLYCGNAWFLLYWGKFLHMPFKHRKTIPPSWSFSSKKRMHSKSDLSTFDSYTKETLKFFTTIRLTKLRMWICH
jgi:hypothetical protein